ncbi:secretion/DNA translocation related CpaE-like protein [Stackebrandtia albiflava]|uniref:Secretion/DNA translocation related CpaE-like protein n=1 Tax=Stackebrandtia albiflava TaxID=406432 RepID=A0A562UYT4_9ACTN|nr:septum site-determining protein Ssd [Stackebrandtia albiflava]TWJ10776.1 secretion/DNA translocation related CpaE-like protein [Stackebrandtia albiflava]
MGTTPLDTAVQQRPLFITADTAVAGRLTELASAAGVSAWTVPDAETAARFWSSASVVVIGEDAVRSCADARFPPRDGVVLLTGPGMPYDRAWPMALTMGADQVASLPEAAPWLVTRLAPQPSRRPRAPVISVSGARGGAGASTLATAVAIRAARQRRRTILIDADPHGAGLDLAMGWERSSGLRWHDLANMPGPFDPVKLRDSLPREGDLTLLSHTRGGGPVGRDQFAAVIDAAGRGHDLVVLDLPRSGAGCSPRLPGAGNLLVVVVPGEVRAVAAAPHVLAAHAGTAERAALVVRDPRRLAVAQIAQTVGVPVVGRICSDPKLPAAVESGAALPRLRRGDLAVVAAAVVAAAGDHRTAGTGAPR